MAHRIVILGAGYAGLTAAKRVAVRLRHANVQVTLVNARACFVERVRLHQLAAGRALRHWPLQDMLDGTGVVLVVARVTGIDVGAGMVRMDAAPYTLGYDTLVYALGSDADVDSVQGAREHAFTIADARQAARLRSHLTGIAGGGVVAVTGGGLTGIEAAAELAEAYPELRVELITSGRVGGWLSERARRHLQRAFDRLGVGLHEGRQALEVGANAVLLDDGLRLAADAIVWAAGFRVPTLAADAGLAVDGHARMVVGANLRSVSHPDVYGVGDAAAAHARGGHVTRMSCQTGLPMGLYVADEIARMVTGSAPRPARIRYVWQNISLGRRDGVTQFTRADDGPTGFVLTGRVAAGFKEAITRGAARRVRHPGGSRVLRPGPTPRRERDADQDTPHRQVPRGACIQNRRID